METKEEVAHLLTMHHDRIDAIMRNALQLADDTLRELVAESEAPEEILKTIRDHVCEYLQLCEDHNLIEDFDFTCTTKDLLLSFEIWPVGIVDIVKIDVDLSVMADQEGYESVVKSFMTSEPAEESGSEQLEFDLTQDKVFDDSEHNESKAMPCGLANSSGY